MLANESTILAQVVAGDDHAFEQLVAAYMPAMMRLARIYVADDAVGDVVQETWIAVLKGLANFEGRSSFKTWLFSILMNRARSYARAEQRHDHTPLDGDDDTSLDPDRFYNDDHQWAGHWVDAPVAWDNTIEQRLISQETMHHIEQVIQTLPPQQREVILLRDFQHFSSDEVCNILQISATNQRVLLHRARTKVRQALDDYLQDEALE